jgi:diacylglycerol O-acyltransferase / wax synthase
MSARRSGRSVIAVSSGYSMPTADAAWLRMGQATNLMVVNSVLWFDDPVDWDACRALFLERIVGRFDRFRQRAVDGLPFTGPRWADDPEFDPDLHFHHVALPAPHDRAALEDFISDRVATPLPRSRPLWEVYLIDDFGTGCALLSRIHHSIADGIALGRVMLTLTDDGEREDPGIAAANGSARHLPVVAPAARAAGTLVQEGIETLLHPGHAREIAAVAASDAQTLAKLLMPTADPRTAIKGEQHCAHRVAWSDPVELWRLKRAGRMHAATVNDVVVAAVAGAVRGHLLERGDDVEAVHALVPFNLRPLDRPLPRELGNRFGLVLLGLPLGIDDPVARLAHVKRHMDEIKNSHEGPISFGILELMGRTPVQLEQRMIEFFSAKASMVLTNVRGPRRRVSLAGTPVAGVLVWAPCSGSVAMSVSVFSYANKVTAGFLTDASLVPQPGQLAAAFRAELLALARSA